jgi:hypothetical protein
VGGWVNWLVGELGELVGGLDLNLNLNLNLVG